jgi:hypothetical protein
VLREAEATYDADREWEIRSEAVRADADEARREPARRAGPDRSRGDLSRQSTECVVYQSVQAEQLLSRKQRRWSRPATRYARVAAWATRGDHVDPNADEVLERWLADQARLRTEVEAANATRSASTTKSTVATRLTSRGAPRPRSRELSCRATQARDLGALARRGCHLIVVGVAPFGDNDLRQIGRQPVPLTVSVSRVLS